MFYGLVLWVCAGSITGSVLLGQVVGVTLLGWFALETGYLRRSLTLSEEQTEITSQLQEKIDSALQSGWVADLLAPITGVVAREKSQELPTPPSTKEPVNSVSSLEKLEFDSITTQEKTEQESKFTTTQDSIVSKTP